ncbi:hypothetical protein AQZ52_11310 [Novosphingobium fuchskuhlense]|uniref:DUF4266 domain-containing protein n=1 Tax=Novosphingobium fuchskuhlense TaxID=1117702 RepID=A0A117UUS3_9SPHN|nr:DUF4266 domain-containing protein [Novosphingobium fuchskuhlense]KUR71246.1 hypothetical protein AQZ52_11310 [Novosphingobium fuchskuhlense]
MARIRAGAALFALAALSGCAHIGAQPWQRDVLARKSMQLAREPAIMAFDEHTYFSKEAASGGRSFDGGGCGCN